MSNHSTTVRKGRGSASNPQGRFEQDQRQPFDDGWEFEDEPPPPLRTSVSEEQVKSILTFNKSPDVGFDRSINPYQGCEHGCIYCFARPSHAYYGLSPGLDFESRLYAKPNAAALLRETLDKRSYRCALIALGVNTDSYQPIERRYRITRQILEVLRDYRHPVGIITKSALIERDIDILSEMAQQQLVSVIVSVTTLDRTLTRRLEPRTAAPHRRLKVIENLRAAGIQTGVLVAPVIPVITDQELESILQAVKDAGAMSANYTLLRLPYELKTLFREWLANHEPLKAKHVMSVVRAMRAGRDNDPCFGTRRSGTGKYAELLAARFDIACRRLGLARRLPAVDCSQFKPPPQPGEQLSLF